MLPPQRLASTRRHTLSSTSALLHSSTASAIVKIPTFHGQTRTFWGWRRRFTEDWSSPDDPLYHRFSHSRTLKTRAKLLEHLKRRGKFDWDSSTKPFFTPKHIRWASHWNHDGGRGQAPWLQSLREKQARQKQLEYEEEVRRREEGEDGEVLSQREREWKVSMEAMRKRIEMDPYEAVFGKRFEPFWSPLVPAWMKDEMTRKADATEVEKTPTVEQLKSALKESATSNAGTVKVEKSEAPEAAKTSPYASYSATSWNSWTNKTKRTEWDSVSGQTKQFEYDPISNRMVEMEAPKPTEQKSLEKVKDTKDSLALAKSDRATDMKSLINTPPAQDTKQAIKVPVTSFTSSQKPAEKQAPVGFAPLNSKAKSTTPQPTKPVALANMPKDDIDLLTANDVRASMGKTKPHSTAVKASTAAEKAAMEQSFDRKLQESDMEIAAILQERSLKQNGEMQKAAEWDQAEEAVFHERELRELQRKKEKLLKDEGGLFHIERQKRELAKLDERLKEVNARHGRLDGDKKAPTPVDTGVSKSNERDQTSQHSDSAGPDLEPIWNALEQQLKRVGAEAVPFSAVKDQIRTQAENLVKDLETRAAEIAKELATAQKTAPKLQSVLERIQSKQQEDLDDSAAHEATEHRLQPALERIRAAPAAPDPDDSAAHEATDHKPIVPTRRLADPDDSAAHEATDPVPNNIPKDWSNQTDLLQAARVSRTAAKRPYPMTRWIDDMNARKAAHESSSLPAAPTPSPEEAEKLAKLAKANALLEAEVQEQKVRMQQHESRYAHKIRSLRQELEVAYKQSTVHSEKHVERIRFLEAEVAKLGAAGGDGAGKKEAEKLPLQGEGDFCTNVTQFAGRGGWYKQTSSPLSTTPASSTSGTRAQNDGKAAQKAKDAALVREVRSIYENAYGVIDAEHTQQLQQWKGEKGVVEVESDVDLGEALAAHEKSQQQQSNAHYSFQPDGLEAELAQQERDVQASLEPKRPFQPDNLEAEIAQQEREAYAALAAAGRTPSSPPPLSSSAFAKHQRDEMDAHTAIGRAAMSWEEMFAASKQEQQRQREETRLWLVDHGILKPKENELAQEAANFYDTFGSVKKDKEFDPTSIENGKLVPKENAMAQEAAEAFDRKMEERKEGLVNPIDGTMKSSRLLQEGMKEGSESEVVEDAETELRHYPRVRRKERVFSGGRLSRKERRAQQQEQGQDSQQIRGPPKPSIGHFVVFCLIFWGFAGAGIYSVGWWMESSRLRRERERRERAVREREERVRREREERERGWRRFWWGGGD